MITLKPSAQKVQDALNAAGFSNQVIELPASTKTAADAAAAVGCEIGQIAKSLVFTTKNTGRPILVIASGSNRVNEKTIGMLVGEPIGKADADFVRAQTGYVIGGVPPLAHAQPLTTFVDIDLFRYAKIWAAAGHPNAVFELTPAELGKMTDSEPVLVT